MRTKKAAIELSIGTIVIIVIAMTMLILTLVLVKNIFTGAKYNVDQINDAVKNEINKLFAEDQRAIVYLPNGLIEIKQGTQWGIAFAIQNVIQAQKFSWDIIVQDDRVKEKCGQDLTNVKVEKWITTGGSGKVEIASGQKYYDRARFNIPEGSVNDVSKCIVRFQLVVKQEDGTIYTTEPFDVQVK